MPHVKTERRANTESSVICDNGTLCLRLTRNGMCYELTLEARDEFGIWISQAELLGPQSISYLNGAGDRHYAELTDYELCYTQDQSTGVIVRGDLDNMRISVNTTLGGHGSTWCRQCLTITDMTPDAMRRLELCWRLSEWYSGAEICWPPSNITDGERLSHPATIMQVGENFAALVPEMEEIDTRCLQLAAHSLPAPEFVISVDFPQSGALLDNLQGSALLCFDARALPKRGFQQVVRMLGSQELLTCMPASRAMHLPGELPALPEGVDGTNWIPCKNEGTPAEIASWTRTHLLCEEEDWERLEEGLIWLDRLCLQHMVFQDESGTPRSILGAGDEWLAVRPWMPLLLLRAFSVTGISEYGHRAKAILSALPPEQQGHVLASLRPIFGDLFVYADTCEGIALTGGEMCGATFDAEGIHLTVIPLESGRPLTLVAHGCEDEYQLTINGVSQGVIDIDELRAGINVPLK